MKSLVLGLIVTLLGFLFLRAKALPLLPSNLILAPVIQLSVETPTGYDPLTQREQDGALAAAIQAEKGATRQSSTGSSQVESKQEVLMIERHEVSKAERSKGIWLRQADVFIYDYPTDTLIHSIVDVQRATVVAVEKVQGVQLPLTQNEEAQTLSLIQADTTLWSNLAGRYQAITGEALNNFSQLHIKTSLFYADSMPDAVNTAAQACGQHRCAQVLIFTVDKMLLELTPIVDLSRGEVVQVME